MVLHTCIKLIIEKTVSETELYPRYIKAQKKWYDDKDYKYFLKNTFMRELLHVWNKNLKTNTKKKSEKPASPKPTGLFYLILGGEPWQA